MKIIRNSIIPFKGYRAINLFGFLFCRKTANIDEVVLNHDSIHTAQMKEMLYVFFYIWYFIEYLIKLAIFCDHKCAYRNISFETEAFDQEKNPHYLSGRKHYKWIKYVPVGIFYKNKIAVSIVLRNVYFACKR